MNIFKKKVLFSFKAQAAVELAVFGAIFIFVIGTIIRQALGFSYQQNQILKALRVAMLTSFRASEQGQASRNTASVLYVEDRLTASSAKYGTIDRVPYILSSTAMHTKQLFMPIESGEIENLNRMDMFINGKHFPLLTTNFKTICLTQNEASCVGSYDEWAGPYNGTTRVWEPDCALQCPVLPIPPEGCPACPANGPCPAGRSGPPCGGGPCIDPCPPCPPNIIYGCVEFRSTTANIDNSKKWCDDATPATLCPVAGCGDLLATPECNLSADQRFDLDRSGTALVPDPDVNNLDGLYPDYEDFSWQWFKVMAFDESVPQGVIGAIYDSNDFAELLSPGLYTHLLTGEGLIFHPGQNDAKNMVLDVDGDLKKEQLTRVEADPNTGIITKLEVMDHNEGDIDLSYNTQDYNNYLSDPTNPQFKPRSGLTRDVRMYTYVNPGTVLVIEEGQLFTPDTRRYVRQTQKKDQIDLVERVIQLNRNTGRFCSGGARQPTVDGGVNPVEACNNCFSSANVTRTCMDEGDLSATDGSGNPLPRHPVIYVRSRIEAKRGRRWVTDTSSDPYVDLNSN